MRYRGHVATHEEREAGARTETVAHVVLVVGGGEAHDAQAAHVAVAGAIAVRGRVPRGHVPRRAATLRVAADRHEPIE